MCIGAFTPLICVQFMIWAAVSALAHGQEPAVPGFGPPPGRRLIPGFGTEFDLASLVTDVDRQNLVSAMRRDANRNGYLDRDELPPWPKEYFAKADLDGDGRLSPYEKLIEGALYRRGREKVAKKAEDSKRRESERQAADKASESDQDPSVDLRLQISLVLAEELMAAYDIDKDKALDRSEWRRHGRTIGAADVDGDGRIVLEELSTWLVRSRHWQPHATIPEGVPYWFRLRDVNFDAQVSMSEFTSNWTTDKIAEFEIYDRNRDGFISAEETIVPRSEPRAKKEYISNDMLVISPYGRIYSDIWVAEEHLIADLNVRVSISKKRDDDVDIYLIGPDRRRLALFTDARMAPWGGGPLFSQTVFDDEAPEVKKKLPRPPRDSTLRPEGVASRRPSLSAYYGKPIAGRWRLAVENTSDQPGVFRGWSLMVQSRRAERSSAS